MFFNNMTNHNSMCGYIYLVTNKITGEQYVGKTIRAVGVRWKQHIRKARSKNRVGYIDYAINKYGAKNFDVKTVCICFSLGSLTKAEIDLIEYYDTYNNGMNLTIGGEGTIGHKHSQETIQKMRESKLGDKSYNYGKRMSLEQRKKLSLAHKGKKLSEETKRKISEANKGVKHSKEHMEKLFNSRRKPVSQFSVNGNVMNIFDSLSSAGKHTGIHPDAISNCLCGIQKTAGGYIWHYA